MQIWVTKQLRRKAKVKLLAGLFKKNCRQLVEHQLQNPSHEGKKSCKAIFLLELHSAYYENIHMHTHIQQNNNRDSPYGNESRAN